MKVLQLWVLQLRRRVCLHSFGCPFVQCPIVAGIRCDRHAVFISPMSMMTVYLNSHKCLYSQSVCLSYLKRFAPPLLWHSPSLPLLSPRKGCHAHSTASSSLYREQEKVSRQCHILLLHLPILYCSLGTLAIPYCHPTRSPLIDINSYLIKHHVFTTTCRRTATRS